MANGYSESRYENQFWDWIAYALRASLSFYGYHAYGELFKRAWKMEMNTKDSDATVLKADFQIMNVKCYNYERVGHLGKDLWAVM